MFQPRKLQLREQTESRLSLHAYDKHFIISIFILLQFISRRCSSSRISLAFYKSFDIRSISSVNLRSVFPNLSLHPYFLIKDFESLFQDHNNQFRAQSAMAWWFASLIELMGISKSLIPTAFSVDFTVKKNNNRIMLLFCTTLEQSCHF